MKIGIPREIKDNEYRVAMPPGGVKELTRHGHQVYVEVNAGVGSGFSDQEYTQAGAEITYTAEETWRRAEMIMKVKEPQPVEYPFLRDDLILFTYLHLAATEELTRVMIDSGVMGVAYETVELADGTLPLLQPMSEVAGKMATQIAAHYLEKPHGGRGMLMGGIPGVFPANVMVLGGGTVGTNAAMVAAGMGANVTILDINLSRLRYLSEILPGNVTTLASSRATIEKLLPTVDAVIGAILIAGARAPHLITREMLRLMQPGSVIVDVAVDQGGCVETTHPTTHSDPIYFVDEVLHYGVANMPGAVPRTSTYGLSNATLRYALAIADQGLHAAVMNDPALRTGINTYRGKLVYAPVAEAFNLPCHPLTLD
ncbi:MAG: alanine dehydrogenase [Anaerolineae bacterium]|nr:alanine dehydrogenase [Anaerolineae bacterium]